MHPNVSLAVDRRDKSKSLATRKALLDHEDAPDARPALLAWPSGPVEAPPGARRPASSASSTRRPAEPARQKVSPVSRANARFRLAYGVVIAAMSLADLIYRLS
jgi:hypothetical protein